MFSFPPGSAPFFFLRFGLGPITPPTTVSVTAIAIATAGATAVATHTANATAIGTTTATATATVGAAEARDRVGDVTHEESMVYLFMACLPDHGGAEVHPSKAVADGGGGLPRETGAAPQVEAALPSLGGKKVTVVRRGDRFGGLGPV